MQRFSASPREMVASAWRNRSLIVQMTVREVAGRYRGSMMGLLWSFFHPVLLLAVYTFVFSVVFKARWSTQGESRSEFALVLFAGLLVFNLFAECVNRAPSLVLSNVNYVKRVVFPLEILPWTVLGSALFHLVISLVVWLVFYVAVVGVPSPTLLLLPVVLAPLIALVMGLCWMLASLGVYLRDVAQVIGIVTTMLMFLSPVLYPASSLPEPWRALLFLNPLTLAIEQSRDVMIWGRMPQWSAWLLFAGASLACAALGFAWFQKTRRGFADVL
jgi:lipopolysaccharide transport system permease protein